MIRITAIACLSLLAVQTASQAVIINYQFALTTDQEVQSPPVVSSASGFAEVSVDTATNQITWNVTFQDLAGTYINAHFHGPAAGGVNAGVMFGIHDANLVGETSGQLTGFTMVDPAITQNILDGLAYINIHSSSYPGGEIRGQVVPEPGTYALFAGLFALAGAGWVRRKGRSPVR